MSASETRENPNPNLQIPEWLNAEYFRDILKEDEPDYEKVLQFRPIAAIPPGENFTSVMLRICMTLQMKDGSHKPKSYILKTTLDLDRGGAFVQELNLFDKEREMYHKYIPEFEALYKAAGRDVQIAPKCLFIEANSDRINIVFEDLSQKEFKVADRLLGYDMEHMRRSLQKLAELHAASAVWYERNGPFPEEFTYGFVNGTNREFHEKYANMKLQDLREAMPCWGLEDVEKYLKTLPTPAQIFNCGLRSMETDPNDFNVLNHGDYWSSNVMLNYFTEGTIKDVIIVDYQLCKWGSPAQDLLFFITLSAAKDIRIKEYDHFVEIYHEHLIDSLKVLNYEKSLPRLRDLQIAMYKENNMFYAFCAIYNHLLIILYPTDKDSNFHALTREDENGHQLRMRFLMNPRYVEAALQFYPFFYNRGLLDFEAFS